MEEGYLIVYRQWDEDMTTHGNIGAAQSEDGEYWFTSQKLNLKYPNGDAYVNTNPDTPPESILPTNGGQPQGRFPSAGFVEGGKPTAIWNEYTLESHGGGQYGGYPLYTLNSLGMGEDTYW